MELSLGFVTLLGIGNLRGIRESARLFAVPTYFFIVSVLALIGVGVWRVLTGTVQPQPPAEPIDGQAGMLTLFIMEPFLEYVEEVKAQRPRTS